jgi:2-oxoacid:acceptor oxidoreductase delta subunit (pyruvate/2-ketoisovalerate family)
MPQGRLITPSRYNPKLKEPRNITYHGIQDTPPASVSEETTLVFKTGGWRNSRPEFLDKIPPCVVACPAGESIGQSMVHVAAGRIDDAIDTLRIDNPLLAVTGRVCFHPCEAECNRKVLEGPVGIQSIERFLGDRGLERKIAIDSAPSGKRVAVIGSGPAGLSFAYQALRTGAKAVVFEKEDVPGGILATGIPEYRLPKHILFDEISLLEDAGLELRLGTEVGKDISFDDILKEYDAVYVATGYHSSKRESIPGMNAEGVLTGLEFLYTVNSQRPSRIGRRTVVVGGGNTAMDAARSALRLGSAVTVAYRRTREMMPAIKEEVDEALDEGVRISYLLAPVEVIVSGNRVKALRCQNMTLAEPDETGRRRPVPIPDSFSILDCDTVIFATGEDPNLGFLPTAWKMLDDCTVRDADGKPVPGVLVGGDLVTSRKTVAHAIGSGKRAFFAVNAFLNGARWEDAVALTVTGTHSVGLKNVFDGRPHSLAVAGPDDINLDHFAQARPHLPKVNGAAALLHGFQEVRDTLSEQDALAEARRCFNCGVCNMCLKCFAYCPDCSVRVSEDGTSLEIDYEYCKGCGICAEECPRGAINMVWEEK